MAEISQGLGGLGFAAIALDWERPFLGPLYARSFRIQGKTGYVKLPVMLRDCSPDRLEGGDRLKKADRGVQGAIPLVFYTDAKAEDGRAWKGGFLEEGDTNKVIAALELLASLRSVRLWVPDGKTKETTRVAIKGYTDNHAGGYKGIYGQPVR